MQQQRPACRDGGTAGPPDSRNRSWRLEAGNSLGAQTWATVLEVGSWRLEVGSSLWEQTWATLRLRSRQARQAFRPATGGLPVPWQGKQAQIVGTALAGLNQHQDIAAPRRQETLGSGIIPGLFLPRCAFFAFFFDAGTTAATAPKGWSER